jgi:hypothetical protein
MILAVQRLQEAFYLALGLMITFVVAMAVEVSDPVVVVQTLRHP